MGDDLSIAIEEAARATTFVELGARALPALARALHACPVFLARMGTRIDRSEPLAGEQPQALVEYVRDFISEDPLGRVALTAPGPVSVLEHHVDRRIVQASRAYHEFHRVHDHEHHLLLRFMGRSVVTPGAMAMGLTRGRRMRPFDARDAELASLALPAFRGAARRIAGVSDACRSRPERPVLALDVNGRVAFMSPRARELIGAVVPPSIAGAARRLASVGVTDTSPTVTALLENGDRVEAELSIAHTPAGETIVLAHLAGGSIHSRLAAQYGLTRAESEVLAVLVLGASNAAIARQLCVSVDTVKTHLQRAFRKLGVRSRTQAMVELRRPR